tara:strand:+ start:47761 stop:48036 length:276 start_codon:yes stop_codon:yes gene_type:complete
MQNPFEIFEKRLANIENLLLDLKHKPEKQTQPENYSVKEASKILKVSEQSVLKYIRKGFLPAQFIGKSYLIKRVDLEASLSKYKSLKHKRS